MIHLTISVQNEPAPTHGGIRSDASKPNDVALATMLSRDLSL